MGRLCSGLTFPVSCLILVWAAGSGSVKVLHAPSCFSDYISTSVCRWKMDSPTNCSAELRLNYHLDFTGSENRTCVPEDGEGTACTCSMLTEDLVDADVYQLRLSAGTQMLWSGSFRPNRHVKPRAPGNLTVHPNASHTWLLMWSNPYPPDNHLHSELTYMVNISNENDPTDSRIYNVTYREPTFRVAASTLKSGASYTARVRAWAQSYNSLWSEWSPSIRWLNHYEPWEHHLQLGVTISCLVILAVCLSCYFSVIKIKKEWWDQIPNPANSRLVAIVIQEPQVSLWGKRSRGQEPAKCPRWKTCLAKLLPCLLEHRLEGEQDFSKSAGNRPVLGAGKAAWGPVEVSKTVLWPEDISVVRCVELLEAPVASKEEEGEEEEEGSLCPSPVDSRDPFQESREGIAARLTESLFLDLLEDQAGSWLPPPGDVGTQMPWAAFPAPGPQEASSQGHELPFKPQSRPPATPAQSLGGLTFPEMPPVITDNPAYRSFGTCPDPTPGEGDSDPELAGRLGEADPGIAPAPEPSEPEPETWEHILRQSVLQHRAAPAPAPSSGYRECVHAVGQGGGRGGGAAGYKAFSSLLSSDAVCPETSGGEAGSGDGGYKPFQSLTPGCPGAPAPTPLFTFGLDMEPPRCPQGSLLPGSSAEPAGKADGSCSLKSLLAPELDVGPLGDDLASGIVYSALTCHLCGHLKQCHGQEERGEAAVASPCCGCCCGDRSSPLGSPLRAPDPLPAGVPLEAGLSPASLVPLAVLEEGTPSLFLQPAPSRAPSSGQTPRRLAELFPEPTCVIAS
ncbi:interleukin-4 receptor subunit alpha isoform X1 [Hyaena hyaena]|uniref:interleukin-4 receptor subunit alpha isoform X1 n=2 Tax=Hyaena hyaena TaxID=95912 RepID=UPI001922A0CD|nr:interleukin-4 receptor subunit alpha isoform X1 [Hyaena hyaena]XP_039113460.1 interleukin-4 receptor subunit alpha isoform X1 [Hyaena hyaena]XP_039113462.1 interleukin-4 receptor subunit alpha isoform X1 [Hyaena hyaena]